MLNVILSAAAATLSFGQPATDPIEPVCRNWAPELVKARTPARVRKLNELPNADMILTVLRTENGCSKPAVVRYDIGNALQGR